MAKTLDKQKDTPTAVEQAPMRPVFILSEQIKLSYRYFLNNLLLALADASIGCAIVCRRQNDVADILPPGVEVFTYPNIDLILFERHNINMIAARLEKFKPTILHALCERQCRFVRSLSRRLGIPYVLSVNAIPLRSIPGIGPLSISTRRCGAIVSPAPSIAEHLTHIYPRLNSRISPVLVGSFTAPSPQCFDRVDEMPVMIVTCPMDDAKDFEPLLSAVKELAISGYEFLLVLMGSGRAENQIHRNVKRLGLSRQVVFINISPFWKQSFSAGDIFIMPVPVGRFSPYLLEAMSSGMAVAGCEGGVDDLLLKDQTAVIFDPDDVLSIRQTLQELLDRREDARKLARNAQQLVREKYSVSEMAENLMTLYRRVSDWHKAARLS